MEAYVSIFSLNSFKVIDPVPSYSRNSFILILISVLGVFFSSFVVVCVLFEVGVGGFFFVFRFQIFR